MMKALGNTTVTSVVRAAGRRRSEDEMGTTALLVFALAAVLAMIAGVTWILWEDASSHRRSHSDLETCESIWALTSDR
jgi:hypothetical protein